MNFFLSKLSNESGTSPEGTAESHAPCPGIDHQQQQASQTRGRAPPLGVFGEENSFEIEFPELNAYDRFLCKARALKSKKTS